MSNQKEEIDSVKADHEKLVDALDLARANRAFVEKVQNDPRIAKILSGYQQDIDATKEALVSAEKKEIDGLQAGVAARRALIVRFKGAYQAELEDAQQALREFEQHNQLFLQQAKGSASVVKAAVMLMLFLFAGGAFAQEPKAEVVEIPASYVKSAPPLKCENGSCWVYHGTTERVNFNPCAQCGIRGTTGADAAAHTAEAPASFPTRYYSKPAQRALAREVVSYDCDWRGR